MNIFGKVEVKETAELINSSKGRYNAYLKRDDKKFCKFHPQIHPDNTELIRLKDGETSKRNKNVVEVENFRYCPRCYILAK